MNKERNIWLRPKEAGNRLREALKYHKEVKVFNDQTSKAGQSYHITVRISFFRYWFRLGRTLRDIKKECSVGMPVNIPFVIYIKSITPWGKWLNYESDVYRIEK